MIKIKVLIIKKILRLPSVSTGSALVYFFLFFFIFFIKQIGTRISVGEIFDVL
jgi:hypothetical protein